MIGNTHLASDHDVRFNCRGASHSGLRRNQCSLANLHVVRQVYKIIEFHLRAQAGNAQRTPGNRCVRANFHVVGDLQIAGLAEISNACPSRSVTYPNPSHPSTAPECTVTLLPIFTPA